MEVLQLPWSRPCPLANTPHLNFQLNYKSKSELLYDCRFTANTANHFVLASSPFRPTKRDFFQLNSYDNSPYVTPSLTRRWVCLLWICLASRQVYISHILYSMLLKMYSFCTTHMSSLSKSFTEQIMPILRILCYNGSLVTWTVLSFTTFKFKPLVFYWTTAPIAFKIIPRYGPRRKHNPAIVVEACLPRRYITTVAGRTTQ
jgi:hypothetical protein